MKYLGVPVSFAIATLKTIDWDFVIAKMIKRLDAWIGNIASSGGRLINSSLSGIPLYYSPIKPNLISLEGEFSGRRG